LQISLERNGSDAAPGVPDADPGLFPRNVAGVENPDGVQTFALVHACPTEWSIIQM
jgi:hypothetical protein